MLEVQVMADIDARSLDTDEDVPVEYEENRNRPGIVDPGQATLPDQSGIEKNGSRLHGSIKILSFPFALYSGHPQ